MEKKENNFFMTIVKGATLSLIFMLVGILIFAGVVKLCNLNSSVIKAVNQFIKVIAIFLGCMFSVRGKLGFLKGALIGLIAIILTYLIFAIFGGGNPLTIKTLLDVLFVLIIGLISGIISVNLRKN